LETAKELEEPFGTYAVITTSKGSSTGSSEKSLEVYTKSRQVNTTYTEISRPLGHRDELINDCRAVEAFIVVRGAKPLSCNRATYFHPPELAAKVQENRFNKIVAS
jgi:type IV secretion system protein VirD4